MPDAACDRIAHVEVLATFQQRRSNGPAALPTGTKHAARETTFARGAERRTDDCLSRFSACRHRA